MKKSEQDDIEKKIGFVKGTRSPSQIAQAETIIKSFYDEKGFGDAEVRIFNDPIPTIEPGGAGDQCRQERKTKGQQHFD